MPDKQLIGSYKYENVILQAGQSSVIQEIASFKATMLLEMVARNTLLMHTDEN